MIHAEGFSQQVIPHHGNSYVPKIEQQMLIAHDSKRHGTTNLPVRPNSAFRPDASKTSDGFQ